MIKDYDYIAFDAQYILHRNFEALKSRTKIQELVRLEDGEGDTNIMEVIYTYNFNANDLVKQFFWTICKFVREVKTCDKVILLWDRSPYHKQSLLPDFKGSRTYTSQETLDEWDVENDPAGYLQEKETHRINMVKGEAKYWIINNLNQILPSVIHDGYEADDLAYILSTLGTKRGAVCSADSDWMYWISPDMHYLNFNKKEAWTYEMVDEYCDGNAKALGITNFEMKKYMDSLMCSHNDLKPTTKVKWSGFKELVQEIMSGDFSRVDDVERFELNMKSFEIESYPDYEVVVEKLKSALDCDLVEVEYQDLQTKGFSVTKKYYQGFLSILDPWQNGY